jgi:predicted RNA-binding Zn ribbon-like protein
MAVQTAGKQQPEPNTKPMRLADHPVLDFLNTVYLTEQVLVDALQSDADVRQWLRDAGWPVETEPAELPPSALLRAARALRSTIRTLVEKQKASRITESDLAPLNALLKQARSYHKVVSKKDGSLRFERKWKQRAPEEVLAPLAESAADLLVNGDFSLVRLCESEQCVLWFYDRTKSHHRRWCSMATCGNRHKVAAFRQRKLQA